MKVTYYHKDALFPHSVEPPVICCQSDAEVRIPTFE